MAEEEEQEAPHPINITVILLIAVTVIGLLIGLLYMLYTNQTFCLYIADLIGFIGSRPSGTVYGNLPCGPGTPSPT
jgi:F0F1-type ATP synthase assembly protein I